MTPTTTILAKNMLLVFIPRVFGALLVGTKYYIGHDGFLPCMRLPKSRSRAERAVIVGGSKSYHG